MLTRHTLAQHVRLVLIAGFDGVVADSTDTARLEGEGEIMHTISLSL